MRRIGVNFRNDAVARAERLREQQHQGSALYPNTQWRQLWDVVILCLVMYTAIVIPFQYAFNEGQSLAWFVVDSVVDVLFIADVFVNFRTAFMLHRE